MLFDALIQWLLMQGMATSAQLGLLIDLQHSACQMITSETGSLLVCNLTRLG